MDLDYTLHQSRLAVELVINDQDVNEALEAILGWANTGYERMVEGGIPAIHVAQIITSMVNTALLHKILQPADS